MGDPRAGAAPVCNDSDVNPPGSRPVLLCDVDGVLCPHRATTGVEISAGFRRGRVPEAVLENARALAQVFDWWWMTAWEHDAPVVLSELLGLNGSVVVELHVSSVRSWKLGSVDHAARTAGRPVAWVDDHVGPRARRWQERNPQHLVVRTCGTVGLDDAATEQLLDFAASSQAACADPAVPLVHTVVRAPHQVGVRRAAFRTMRRAARYTRPLR